MDHARNSVQYGAQEELMSKEDFAEKLTGVAKLAVVVSAQIANAESLGLGFPTTPLYSVFCAFDYVAAACRVDDECDSPGGAITYQRYLDAADAALCHAYVHASSQIGAYYDSAYTKMMKKFSRVDVSAYEFGLGQGGAGKIAELRQAERRFNLALISFKGTVVQGDKTTYEQQVALYQRLSGEERLKLMDCVDEWVEASKERYLALCWAIPCYEEEYSRKDRVVEFVSTGIDVADDTLDVLDLIKTDI